MVLIHDCNLLSNADFYGRVHTDHQRQILVVDEHDLDRDQLSHLAVVPLVLMDVDPVRTDCVAGLTAST